MALRLCGSTPAVGSSSTITSGSWTSAQAMLRRRFMPPLKVARLSPRAIGEAHAANEPRPRARFRTAPFWP